MGALNGKFVVLGISGGIAAYRSCELARSLIKAGAQVQVVLSEAAAEFVGPLTFQALTGRPAEVGQGGNLAQAGMDHIDLGRQADLFVLAPATANTLAKIAHGLADNLLTTTVLASTCPVVLAPAMNTRMWENPMTRRNMGLLADDQRIVVVGPGVGSLACGEQGPGRMAEPDQILAACVGAVSETDLLGHKILISAGPTREAIDPVRFLSNRSSGKMGYALAQAAAQRGARVVLISGPTSLAKPSGVERIDVVSAAQMAVQMDKHLKGSHAVLMVAAVADFRPRRVAKAKIKKTAGGLPTDWVRTRDILASLGKKAGQRVLVGFAAETGDPSEVAQAKRKAKKLDLVVANDVSQPDAGFAVDTNRALLADRRGVEALGLMSKIDLADRILDRVVSLLAEKKIRPIRSKRPSSK